MYAIIYNKYTYTINAYWHSFCIMIVTILPEFAWKSWKLFFRKHIDSLNIFHFILKRRLFDYISIYDKETFPGTI